MKAFLIICVILGNSLEYVNPACIDTHYFILVLYIFHMPMFTFVSGYFSNKSSRTTQEKVTNIFKIYICTQTFYFILGRLLGDTGTRLEFLTPQWTLWYFLSLMFWYIVSDFIKNKKKWIIVSILVALYIGFDYSVGSYVSTSRTFFFLPFFVAGMAFNEKKLEKIYKNKILLGISSFALLLILYFLSENTPVELLFEYTRYTSYFDSALYPLFIRIFHYISAFTVGAFILSVIPTKQTFLSFIGQNSIVMYISHAAVIKILYKYNITSYPTFSRLVLSELIILLITASITLLYHKINTIIKNQKTFFI